MKSILFVVNVDWFFASHRLPIALTAIKKGYQVHIATNFTTYREQFENLGLVTHQVNFCRGKTNPFTELYSIKQLLNVIKFINPTITHAVTIKPVLYTGLLLRFTKITNFVAAISGLGTSFTSSGLISIIRLFLIKKLYQFGFNNQKIKVIFQNEEDRVKLQEFIKINDRDISLIKGSGVDLKLYNYTPEPETIITITMASRLLIEKGVYEFIDLAKKITTVYPHIKFVLAGTPDEGNPKSVSIEEWTSWKKLPFVEIAGHIDNIAELFSKSNVIVLPSRYGEGLPKVLIEAAATGRPIVTTDLPGCRDSVINGVTGILVNPTSPNELYNATERLILDKNLRLIMGKNARSFACKTFDINIVIEDHLNIYESFH